MYFVKNMACFYSESAYKSLSDASTEADLTQQRGCSSGVERNLAKVDVVGSNPIIRSKCTDSSVVERLSYTQLVGGSNPSPCTINKARKPKDLRAFPYKNYGSSANSGLFCK